LIPIGSPSAGGRDGPAALRCARMRARWPELNRIVSLGTAPAGRRMRSGQAAWVRFGDSGDLVGPGCVAGVWPVAVAIGRRPDAPPRAAHDRLSRLRERPSPPKPAAASPSTDHTWRRTWRGSRRSRRRTRTLGSRTKRRATSSPPPRRETGWHLGLFLPAPVAGDADRIPGERTCHGPRMAAGRFGEVSPPSPADEL
jgi:hypothetical protein